MNPKLVRTWLCDVRGLRCSGVPFVPSSMHEFSGETDKCDALKHLAKISG
ncbi:MAG TPA: hypothetical protein VFB72_08590 [Verrucomicrobiae bacterium]|nr:hypothetical protein [Verrucomicrobiae bacterium]